jgi:hypothetical protein
MKYIKKYGALSGLLIAVTVSAQTPAPVKLSVSDMRSSIEAMKARISEDERHVLHVQALVRKDKDVIKLTCVNDKLIQMKAQMDLFDNANLQLEAGASSSNDEITRSSYQEAEKASEDVKRLRGEADGCAGELELYKQESRTDVERPPDLDDPTDDGGFDGEGSGPDIDVPAFATADR